MSATKYAGLPDIDTAQDVYETPDTFTTFRQDGDSSDDDGFPPQRVSGIRGRNAGGDVGLVSREELDSSPLIGVEIAARKFRNAEKQREHRLRLTYAYPPSPTSDDDASPSRPPPLSHRLRTLQHEVASLEAELSDPSNPLLHGDNGEAVDPGVLMKGLVDVRGRLEKVRKTKDGRGKLVERVLGADGRTTSLKPSNQQEPEQHDPLDVGEMDRRVGELERLVGSSGITLDDSSSLPPPLFPLVTRLSNQLTLLTQPRHIDSISRRLKLLLSDLERVSAAQASSQNRRQSQPSQPLPPVSSLQESLQPVLTRLAPILPHIPHILTRLRTLSSLHTSASAFHETLQGMEQEQRRVRSALDDLERAVETVEKSVEDNSHVTLANVSGLEERVEEIGNKMEKLGC